jgi:pilus assembly protein CpaD
MIKNITLVALAAASLGACSYHGATDEPRRGVLPVNEPVVTRADFALDVAAPGGSLPPSEAARLDGWFRGLQLGFGDVIYVDGPLGPSVRGDVAQVAGRYGMMVSDGAPVTAGQLADGTVRVVVSRTHAEVPNCPNWSDPASPNYQNKMLGNFGCGVNGNLAAMIANPEDLVRGREGGITDPKTAVRAIDVYRNKAPSGQGGLQSVSTKSGGN